MNCPRCGRTLHSPTCGACLIGQVARPAPRTPDRLASRSLWFASALLLLGILLIPVEAEPQWLVLTFFVLAPAFFLDMFPSRTIARTGYPNLRVLMACFIALLSAFGASGLILLTCMGKLGVFGELF